MNMVRIPVLALVLLVSPQVFAATAQQEKMTSCNAEATSKTLKGDERQAFMSTCLKAGSTPAAATATTPQERMKSCNADAASKALKGDPRKTFMSECLKKK
ncbi:phosphate starvation-inducible protein PsiF [Pseudomonas cavernicola]|uniref:Phosphate starvation-inducible protein PsiF n=1 Tax=Pseudomonas cavernicola TaxID=2320866 RepID=A0A418XLD6_9PSED|nr:PsiF family protein [Pseudomonas cavernicola]RJG13282.1 phosphate starvation-inducible protein PsiF [Pseudomonas cavernicola]